MILSVCLGILLVGIVMVPSAFAAFPDPEKDPRDYLVRYYTEPSYQAWFDKNYPNDTIEDKVGYSKKIVTDDYYVDDAFEFALKYPSMYWELDDTSIDESVRALAGFSFWSNEQMENQEYGGGFLVYYQQRLAEMDSIPDDLLYWYSEYPSSSMVYVDNVTSQLKINNQIQENDGTRDIIRYEYTTSEYYSSDFWIEEMAGNKFVDRNVIVIFLYPNGDEYQLIFSAAQDSYPQLINEFNKIVDSFYVGETEKLSDLLADYAPHLEEAIAAEEAAEAEPKPTSEPTQQTSGGCGEGTVLKGNTCVLAPQESSEGCGAGTVMVNGVCQLDNSSGSRIPPIYIAGGAAAIGAAILGIVSAVRRGSKTSKPQQSEPSQPQTQSVSSTVKDAVNILADDDYITSEKKARQQELEEYEEKYLARQGQRPTRKPAESRPTSSSCSNCGNTLKPTAKFCGKCGTPRS